MKKNSSIVLIICVLLIVAFVNGLVRIPQLHAVDVQVTSETLGKQPQTVPESTAGAMVGTDATNTSDYILPYPGILPDHPLYFLKEFRDRIIEMLIVDPSRKSEFYLLQSDKSLSAGSYLIEKKQTEKAKQIVDVSSSKMGMAVAQLSSLKAAGRQIPSGAIDNIERAMKKHTEVLKDLTGKSFDTTTATDTLVKAQEELKKLK